MFLQIDRFFCVCMILVIGGCATSSSSQEGSTNSQNILDGMLGPFLVHTNFDLPGNHRHIAWNGRWIVRSEENEKKQRIAEIVVSRGLSEGSCGTQMRVISTDSSALGMVTRSACLAREGIASDELESWLAGQQAPNPALSFAFRPSRAQNQTYLTNREQVTGTLFIKSCEKDRLQKFAKLLIPPDAFRLEDGEKTDIPGAIQTERIELRNVSREAWKDLRECTNGKHIGKYPGSDALISDLEINPVKAESDNITGIVSELMYIVEELGRRGQLTNAQLRKMLHGLRSVELEPGAGKKIRIVTQLEETRAGLSEALGGTLGEDLEGIFDQAVTDVLGTRPIITGPLPEICVEPPETCLSQSFHVDASVKYGPDQAPDGTAERPFPKIVSALEMIRERDLDCAPTLIVNSGLYREDLIDPPSVNLQVPRGEQAVILGQVRVGGSTSFKMSGFWISGSWDGPGLGIGRCASVEVSGSRILGSTRYGIHQTGGRLLLSNTEVSGVRRDGNGRTEGAGLYQQAGSASLYSSRFQYNEGPAILAEGTGSRIKGTILEIHNNNVRWPEEIPEPPVGLGAVEAGDGAQIVLRLSTLTDNEFIGLLAREDGSIEFTEGYVRETLQISKHGGFGAFALGGSVRLENFTLAENELCGMAVARDGDLDALFGTVENHPIGACVHVPDYNLDRIYMVQFINNDTNVESVTFALPEPEELDF